MHDNATVMLEWYDWFIPPRHHMAMVSYADAKRVAEEAQGRWTVCILGIYPEILNEATTVKRSVR